MDEVTDSLFHKLAEGINGTPFELVIEILAALVVALIVVQGFKSVVKWFWFEKHLKLRRLTLFLVAYISGFQSTEYFVTDPGKLSVFIALVNPVVYIALSRLAYAKNWLWLLALLKGRKLKRDKDGKLSLEETQQFHVDDV